MPACMSADSNNAILDRYELVVLINLQLEADAKRKVDVTACDIRQHKHMLTSVAY